MQEDQPRAKMGRPRKYPGTEKRPTLTFRVRDGLYERLIASAEASERSLSEEIERRLERSYEVGEVAEATANAVVELLRAKQVGG